MRNVMRAGALAAIVVLALSTAVLAQTADPVAVPTSTVSGTMVGDGGGAYQIWNVTLPAGTDVTFSLNYWPCNAGDAIGIEAWDASGLLGWSSEADACTQEVSWNTDKGGPAEIKVHNYLDGVGTWWSLTSTGVALPGAVAPVAAAPVEPAKAEVKGETVMVAKAADTTTTETKAVETTTAEAAPVVAKAEPATGTIMVDNSVLYGDSGGANQMYDLMVTEGTTYDATMVYASPNGGTWPGVGFKVWGPDGLVAQSMTEEFSSVATASFTAEGNNKYYIQVFNYHGGVPVFYSLEVKPAAQ